MPWDEVMHKFKHGTLKSGGSGEKVKSRDQAIAIMLSEKRQAKKKPEYRSSKLHNKSNPGQLTGFDNVMPDLSGPKVAIRHPGAMARAKRQASAAHGAE